VGYCLRNVFKCVLIKGDMMESAENTEVACRTERESWDCKNMKEYGDDMDCERYRCDVCGRTMKLYYDEMR